MNKHNFTETSKHLNDVMNIISLNNKGYINKPPLDASYKEIPKIISNEEHQFWPRARWLFCKVLTLLEQVELKSNQDLFDKAMKAWEDAFDDVTPQQWMKEHDSHID